MSMLFQVLLFISFEVIRDIKFVTCYDKHIHKLDVVDFQVLYNRNKRTAFSNAYSNTPDKNVELEIKFMSFGKNFHLLLVEDESFQKVPITTHDSHLSNENVGPRTKFYYGYLKNESANSSVLGFLIDGLLTGKITDHAETYFIEPENTYFDNFSRTSKKIVVYRDADMRQRYTFPQYPESFPEWKVLFRVPDVPPGIRVENTGIDIYNKTKDLFCEIEFVADHTLYNHFRNNVKRLSAVLYLHGKFADYVFREADFNMDGIPDGIRIVVGKISIYKTENDRNYPMLEASSVSEYLTLFASRKQDSRYCLSIAAFYKQYEGTIVGESFKAEVRYTNAMIGTADDAAGGICDPPLLQLDGSDPVSFNTGVINMQFENGKPLPLAITMSAFAHEIGHGFGSGHDPVFDSECSPGKQDNFLMYPVSMPGSKNSKKFSTCSLRAISEVLLSKGSCLKHPNASCGNSVREDDEECDCGNEMSCNLIDPCCTPSDAKPPDKGCSIRSKKGFKCSYKENECCSKNCLIIRNREHMCYRDENRCRFSYCDGKSATCPKPKVKPELCAVKYTCNDTVCTSNATLCTSVGLEGCFCNRSLDVQCVMCCQKEGECIPASELGLVDPNGNPFILYPGTSCNKGKNGCDNAGNCIGRIHRHISSDLYTGVTAISSLLIAFTVLAMCVSFGKRPQVSLRASCKRTIIE